MDCVTLSDGGLRAVVSDLGAELQSLTGADGAALLWHGDPAFWTGRAPLLFPIVGRAPGDSIRIGGQDYPMPQHGFARRSRFERVATGPDFCRHILRDSASTRAVYPFAFALEVTHRMEGQTLTVAAVVSNTGAGDMPFGFGFHPAFMWPLPHSDGALHCVTLENAAEPARVGLQADGLLARGALPSPFTMGRLDLHPALFNDGALVFPEGGGTALRYGPEHGPNGDAGLRFAFENLPNLALWTKPGAPFLCIEPWHGMAAYDDAGPDIIARPGTVILPPEQSCRFAMTITAT